MTNELDGVIIGIYESHEFTSFGEQLNTESKGALLEKWKISGKTGKVEDSIVEFGVIAKYPRIAIVGLGKKEATNSSDNQRLATGVGIRALIDYGAINIGYDSTFGNLKASTEGAFMAKYKYRSSPKPYPKPISVSPYPPVHDSPLYTEGQIVAEAQNWARDLSETPANLMTPTHFVAEITKVFSEIETKHLSVQTHGQKWIEEQKMGLLLGVAQGSVQEPKFVIVHYNNTGSESQPAILVGKGITFDSGGICLKPAAGMPAMKADMAGGASVVASLLALTKLGEKGLVKVNVIAIVPLTENLPSGSATKPGDVHTSRSGKTVEITNTDAEGRLVLADALDYAVNVYQPRAVIDVATLTGAIGVALGWVCAGVFTTSDRLWEQISKASAITGERMWRMPVFDDYRKQMESNVADINNLSGQPVGGACTAAAFLKDFAVKPGVFEEWMHIDIAGVMSNDNCATAIASKGMSGKPVRTLVELVKHFSF